MAKKKRNKRTNNYPQNTIQYLQKNKHLHRDYNFYKQFKTLTSITFYEN